VGNDKPRQERSPCRTEIVPGAAGDGFNPARSFLFYKEIIQVTPENWVRSFLPKETREEIRKDLALEYFKNHIVESYLIAAKVADKLRYLMPAQDILSVSIRILLVWLFVDALTFGPCAGAIQVDSESESAGHRRSAPIGAQHTALRSKIAVWK
jgi:hypothetical protein